MASAEGPTTELPAGVGIKCFQCTGEDDKCRDEDDGGSIQACDAEVETCTITKLEGKTDGKVLYKSADVGLIQKDYNFQDNMGAWVWLA